MTLAASSRPPPKEEAIRAQPTLIGDTDKIGVFEGAE